MPRIRKRITFIFGFSIGVFAAIIIKCKQQQSFSGISGMQTRPFQLGQKWFKEVKLYRGDLTRHGNISSRSDYFYHKVKILCVILVKSPKYIPAIKDTWTRTCNQIKFILLETIKPRLVIERRKSDASWTLLCKFLRNFRKDDFWTLVVYDNTFVVMENLRMFLAALNPHDEHYLGYAIKFWNVVYNLGQAGYVLSPASLKKLNSKALCENTHIYRTKEDYYLGLYLNVTPSDTRDANDLSTFHPMNLNQAVFTQDTNSKSSVYPYKCCSPFTIAFQAIEGDKMYTYYYLINSLKIFNFGDYAAKKSRKSNTDDYVWRNFLKSLNVSVQDNISAEQYYNIWTKLIDDPESFAKSVKGKQEEYKRL